MYMYPAIDLYDGKAVRLYKGDYAQMTVYSENPVEVALAFKAAGAKYMHLVDLQGAKTGKPENAETIVKLVSAFGGFVEVGGGIRNMETVESYLALGVDRVILGTAAVKDPVFLEEALQKYGEKIAVSVDLRDGYAAIRGWQEKSALSCDALCQRLKESGVSTVICTDISRDGAMRGTNRQLYKQLSQKYSMDIIASGGVSSMEDVKALKAMDIHGAIVGKAYYTGAIDLKKAVEETL